MVVIKDRTTKTYARTDTGSTRVLGLDNRAAADDQLLRAVATRP